MAESGPPRTQSSFETPRTTVQKGDQQGTFDQNLIERRCRLTVLTGERSGLVVEIDGPRFSVGKGETADLQLGDATVSREHFLIEQQVGGFVIRDQQSTNGTWIDQFRIREAFLRPGTIVRAGEVQIRFEPLFKHVDVAPSEAERFGSLVGRSIRMRQIFTLLERVARTEATIILLGETGAGKSAVARAIHEESPRHEGPFITIDCGAISENLIESELFGHERGAFTGAVGQRRGALEQAQRGTLFIDELADLPVHLQPRLLRVLEEREVRRVGGNEAIKLDVRVIAASRKDLWREVEAGRFREDLYFRLAVFTIPLPPLRERKDDIPTLVASFASTIPGGDRLIQRLTPDVTERLKAHPFYGNVRELRNVVERAIHLDGDPTEALGSAVAVPTEATNPGAHLDALTEEMQLPIGAGAGRPPPAAAAARLSSGPASPAVSMADAPAGEAPTRPPPSAVGPLDGGLPAPAMSEPGPLAPAAGPALTSSPSGVVLRADCTAPFKEAKEALLDAFEAEYLKHLIERESGSASAMARAAGIDRKHLYTLAKKHDVDLQGGGK